MRNVFPNELLFDKIKITKCFSTGIMTVETHCNYKKVLEKHNSFRHAIFKEAV